MAGIEKACKEAKNFIAMRDFNCDREMKNDPLKRGDVKAVTDILEETMSKSGLYQMNWAHTRHEKNCSSSILDLILTNVPNKLDSISAKVNIISDHSLIYAHVHCSNIVRQPQFRNTRDWKLPIASNIMPYIVE